MRINLLRGCPVNESKWAGLDQPITADDAEREPQSQRLSFARPLPSPATRAALAQAERHAPPIDRVDRIKAGQRPRRAG